MSDGRPLFHGWRARTHFLTRDRRFLLRTSAIIVTLGLIVASLIVISSRQEDSKSTPPQRTPAQNRVHREYHELRHAPTPQPRSLALWLRLVLGQMESHTTEDGTDAHELFASTGMLAGYDAALVVRAHSTSDAPAGLFQDFLAAALGSDPTALERLSLRASAVPHEILASELFGSVQKRLGNTDAAMRAFFTEGLHFPDATAAREESLRLAVTRRNLEILTRIAEQPGWIESFHPLLQHHAGALLGDVWMQWQGLIKHRLTEVPYGMLALAFFVAALWYFILVQHSDQDRWRWARPMPALMAGVCSVWPTLTILAYQEYVQGMTSEAPFPHDLLYYLIGVGLREEGCKLALFALFLPWLLWRQKPGLALLTGAFVGLGFSLHENIGYYQDFGGTIAWLRFLSANFLHISLTGICAHSLYNMLRTRFARAEEFIFTFAAAVAAHGGYDWLATGKLGDNGWLSIIVLVVTASRFIDLLATETDPRRLTISPRAVFTFGSALLIAVSFVLGAWTSRSMSGVATAGQSSLAMVPIALLYWRKFENA